MFHLHITASFSSFLVFQHFFCNLSLGHIVHYLNYNSLSGYILQYRLPVTCRCLALSRVNSLISIHARCQLILNPPILPWLSFSATFFIGVQRLVDGRGHLLQNSFNVYLTSLPNCWSFNTNFLIWCPAPYWNPVDTRDHPPPTPSMPLVRSRRIIRRNPPLLLPFFSRHCSCREIEGEGFS